MRTWGTRKCAWCGKEFQPVDGRQIYCSVKCREAAKNFNRPRTYKERPGINKCDREDCRIYKEKMQNHCNGLIEVPDDPMKCKFYKEKKK